MGEKDQVTHREKPGDLSPDWPSTRTSQTRVTDLIAVIATTAATSVVGVMGRLASSPLLAPAALHNLPPHLVTQSSTHSSWKTFQSQPQWGAVPLLHCKQTPCCRISQKRSLCPWSIAPWKKSWEILAISNHEKSKPPWCVQTGRKRVAGRFRPHLCILQHTQCSWLDLTGQTPARKLWIFFFKSKIKMVLSRTDLIVVKLLSTTSPARTSSPSHWWRLPGRPVGPDAPASCHALCHCVDHMPSKSSLRFSPSSFDAAICMQIRLQNVNYNFQLSLRWSLFKISSNKFQLPATKPLTIHLLYARLCAMLLHKTDKAVTLGLVCCWVPHHTTVWDLSKGGKCVSQRLRVNLGAEVPNEYVVV